MVVGLILRLTAVASVRDVVSFDYQMFFNLLLPPIILSAGYELHQVSLNHSPRQTIPLTQLGQLFQTHWHHPYLCFCWHLHLRPGSGPHPVPLDQNSP